MNVIDFLSDIVKIPSLSGEEGGVARRLKEEFEKLGYDEIIQSGGNVCARKGSGRMSVLYDAHMDTVEAGEGWRTDPCGAVIKDGVMFGRGTCDDKGTLAAMVYGGAGVNREDITLYVLGSVREEVSSGNGLQDFLHSTGIRPDFAVIGEPSELKVATGNKGRVGLRIDVSGKAGHASRPALADNAVYKAAGVIEEIRRLNSSFSADTVSVTRVETPGRNINVIPDRCSLFLDYRSSPESSLDDIRGNFNFLGEGINIEVITPYYKPWRTEEEGVIARAARRCNSEVLDMEEDVFWDFCTNGSHTAGEMGIPTVGFGPGDPDECHSADERIKTGDVVRAVKFFEALPGYLMREVKSG